jgi:nickel/cobalt exporter
MNSTVLTTIAATGFTVAFLHAAIPTHWLPFVLVSRARGWSRGKTLGVVALAGAGHVVLTSLLGLAIAWFGFKLDERVGAAFPWIAAGFLGAMGLFYFWRQWRGGGICHHPVPGGHHRESAHCGHEEAHTHWDEELKDSALVSTKSGDRAAVGGLFLMLTLSPCEGFLPIYLAGVKFGRMGFFTLSAILAVAALAAMLLFTSLALHGLERFKIKFVERYEAGLLGALFAVLGVLVVVLER